MIESGNTDPIIFQHPDDPSNLDERVAQDWMDGIDRRLKPHVVEVPKAWRRHTLPDHRFPRDCFARALYFIQQSRHLPNALYVFGETSGGGLGQHGWVEIDDRVVFDGVMQQFYDKAGYYDVEFARPWYRFTRPAVMYLRRKTGGDSRWGLALGLPWAKDPKNPLLVDLADAKEYLRQMKLKAIRN
jgi:LmbE family N-acetylglucosaminyl deacetylase